MRILVALLFQTLISIRKETVENRREKSFLFFEFLHKNADKDDS